MQHGGERLVIDEYQSTPSDYLIYMAHLATYKWCLKYLKNKTVLDYGCGTGYGTFLVAQVSSHVTGVDISPAAIDYARTHYSSLNLEFMNVQQTDVTPLPFESSSFDVVILFQVIEHILNISHALLELRRVLRSGGHLIIATPDRTSRLFSFQKPWNLWHIREYSQLQLHSLLANYFEIKEILHMSGRKDAIKIELNRTRRLKWITLPLTLPVIPESVRVWGLRLSKQVAQRLRSKRGKLAKMPFDDTALFLTEDSNCSINLIAVVVKR